MKRKLMIVLSLLCILALTVPAFVSAETVKTAVNGGSLRLRKKATTSSATVGFVQDGDHIDVLSKGSIWSKVETNSGKVGYIKTLYIKGAGSAYASGTTYTARRAGKTTAAGQGHEGHRSGQERQLLSGFHQQRNPGLREQEVHLHQRLQLHDAFYQQQVRPRDRQGRQHAFRRRHQV